MRPTEIALAPSESKSRFMERLGLDLNEETHKRLYKAMKVWLRSSRLSVLQKYHRLLQLQQQFTKDMILRRVEEGSKETYLIHCSQQLDAVNTYLQIVGQRNSLLPQLQRDPTVNPPYTYAQVSETTLHRAILAMYAHANNEIRLFYDKGRSTDGIEEENWVIRWLLWHVFRYRDRRNRAQYKDSTKDPRQPGTASQQIDASHNIDDDSDTTPTLDMNGGSARNVAYFTDSVSSTRQPARTNSCLNQPQDPGAPGRLPYDPARDL